MKELVRRVLCGSQRRYGTRRRAAARKTKPGGTWKAKPVSSRKAKAGDTVAKPGGSRKARAGDTVALNAQRAASMVLYKDGEMLVLILQCPYATKS